MSARSTNTGAVEHALEQAQKEARRIAAAAEQLREEGAGRLDEQGVRDRLTEMSEAMDEMRSRFVQQVEDSWTLVGPNHKPVAAADSYLGWLSAIERSPNTVRA